MDIITKNLLNTFAQKQSVQNFDESQRFKYFSNCKEENMRFKVSRTIILIRLGLDRFKERKLRMIK